MGFTTTLRSSQTLAGCRDALSREKDALKGTSNVFSMEPSKDWDLVHWDCKGLIQIEYDWVNSQRTPFVSACLTEQSKLQKNSEENLELQ